MADIFSGPASAPQGVSQTAAEAAAEGATRAEQDAAFAEFAMSGMVQTSMVVMSSLVNDLISSIDFEDE